MQTSICEIIVDHYTREKRLRRLCDISGVNVVAIQSEQNRVLRSGNLDEKWAQEGLIGIWTWDTEGDIRKTKRVQNNPVEVVVCPQANSLENIIETLRSGGIERPRSNLSVIFATKNRKSGLLFGPDDLLETTEGKAILKKDVFSALQIGKVDFVSGEDSLGNRRSFYRYTNIPQDPLYYFGLDELFRDIVKRRLAEKFQSKDLRALEAFIDATPRESIVDEVVRITGANPKAVREELDRFLIRVPYFDQVPDVKIIDVILSKSPDLFKRCVDAVLAQEPEALANYSLRIDERRKVLSDLEEAEKLYSEEIDNKRLQIAELERVKEEFQKELDERAIEFQTNTGKYLADVFGLRIPRETVSTISSLNKAAYKLANRELFVPGTIPEGNERNDFKEFKDFDDARYALADALSPLLIDEKWSDDLATFLFILWSRRVPLLFAGRGGMEIAERISLILNGKRPDILSCEGEYDSEATEKALVDHDSTLVVMNPFNGNWFERLILDISAVPKTTILITPFVDDLRVEPRGIYDYVVPFTMDYFIPSKINTSEVRIIGKFTKSYQPFNPSDKTDELFKKLAKKIRMPLALSDVLSGVLADSRSSGVDNKELCRYFFGLRPFASMAGEAERFIDLLRENADHENLTGIVETMQIDLD